MPSSNGGIIRPIAYNHFGDQDESLIVNDMSFSVDEPFLLILNKSVPKYSKVYIEIVITSHPDNPKLRYIPLYFGVHKEPSFGILNSDFCIGNVYYTTWKNNIDFDIAERYDAAGKVTHTAHHDSGWKIPIVGTVIGLGVDMPKNKIEIFSDGHLFYSFTPKTWTMNNQSDSIYMAIYGNYYEHIEGYINAGRYKTVYRPSDYWTLYEQYYGKDLLTKELPISMYITGTENQNWYDKLFNINANIQNTIAPLDPGEHRRTIKLIHSEGSPSYMDFKDNINNGFNMISKYNPNNGLEIPSTASDMTTVNLPIPTDAKVYFEFHIAEGVMNEDKIGIPISIGISNRINDLTNKSVWINLWHDRYDRYKVHRYYNNKETVENAGEILTPVTPLQPKTLGVLFDLANNQMTITLEGNIFTVVNLKSTGVDFSNYKELSYAFLKCEDKAFTGQAYGICNFGEDSIECSLNSDEMTLWYYYNGFIRFQLGEDEIPYLGIVFNTLPYKITHRRHFTISFTVAGSESEEEKKFSPGLNKLFDTYNVVTDTEPHMNEPDQNIFDFKEWVDEDLKNNDRREWMNKEMTINFFVQQKVFGYGEEGTVSKDGLYVIGGYWSRWIKNY